MSLPAAAPTMTEHDARRITERIRSTIVHTRESIEKIQRLLGEARDGLAHVALGYSEGEWTRYMADLFADQPLRLPRDQRDQLVGYLAGEGMAPAAIAPIVGVTRRRVSQIRSAIEGGSDFHPGVNPETGEVSDDYPSDDTTGGEVTPPADQPAPTGAGVEEPGEAVEATSPIAPPARPAVTGLDGKTYQRPEPRRPQRRPITDQARDAGWDLTKSVERLQRIASDDRFPPNKEAVALHMESHLTNAIEVCQDLLDRINN